MNGNLTDRAQMALQFAEQEARHLEHDEVNAHHLLLGILREDRNVGAHALRECGITLFTARTTVAELFPPTTVLVLGDLSLQPALRQAIEQARIEQQQLESSHDYTGPEHLLLGLILDETNTAMQVLQHLKVPVGRIREKVLGLLGVHKPLLVQEMDQGLFLLQPPTASFEEGATAQTLLLRGLQDLMEEWDVSSMVVFTKKKT